ncbi:MAG: hypothetical protein LC687_01640 [Actinobacteria bacterium]|nr:hypothetical protein [Actinomycetota bacterium]
MGDRTRVSGPVAVEGEPTGDGRLYVEGAFRWNGVLPIPIIWDSMDGDHSGATLGAIETLERRPNGIIWGDGYVEHSDVPEFELLVLRVLEILEQGAVGVSLRYDDDQVEIRVKRELVDVAVTEEMATEAPQLEESEDGRIVVARMSADDVLYTTTSCRVRHLAIVDTAAMVMAGDNRFGVAASGQLVTTGAIAASALAGDWSAYAWMADNPNFGEPGTDPRVKYDPDRGAWSCPPTLTDDGHYFGHITPMGICLRGRPDRCITPPEGDLEGFMRGRAPFAGGLRTGVVVCGEGSSHCDVGIGAALATQHYDKTGKAAADVRVGRDQYGIWFSGMVRPGVDKNTVYALEASDVSGHWEYTQTGRMTLVGLPAVNVGGFPKGYLSYEEFSGGLAASAGISIEEGCTGWTALEEKLEQTELSLVLERLDQIGAAVAELWGAHVRSTES